MAHHALSRREFFFSSGMLLAASVCGASPAETPPVVDIHQHTNYSGRSDDDLIAHQRAMGVTHTILLPAGSMFGLDAQAGGNDTVVRLASQHPKSFSYFANEVSYLPTARQEIEKYLKRGALGIGEQKFQVECDSVHMERIAELAREHKVPVLMHFEHGKYNTGIERFHKMLEKFPTVPFIGHAQTWWANIDRDANQAEMYPKGKVTPGGITDRLLSDHPNLYGDLSAFSGLNSLLRDEEHARGFLERHQDKLLWGSDCNDRDVTSARCYGTRCLAAIRRLAPGPKVVEKILYRNAVHVMKLKPL